MVVNAEYGIYQELGTKYIKARGWITKTIDEKSNLVVKAVQQTIEGLIKGAI
jgi:hypothetical protein